MKLVLQRSAARLISGSAVCKQLRAYDDDDDDDERMNFNVA